MKIFDYRKQIDRIDKRILILLNQRAKLALKIGDEKIKYNIAVESKEREEAVLLGLLDGNKGPLNDEDVFKIYQSIIYACRNLQHVQQV
ncbi:MAG: hypothetical protein EHM72_15655 [Calditrichaeota bacterium]|nr:MAG: hypothetical protein EHM72_15655 [Calditrichota bacterium]